MPVDDGSELGMVEAGFNRMAAGLRERERLRDVGALFVDVLGSTAMAESLAPERVVTC